jgi:deoxyadenosine/deoxycytidine kinase
MYKLIIKDINEHYEAWIHTYDRKRLVIDRDNINLYDNPKGLGNIITKKN